MSAPYYLAVDVREDTTTAAVAEGSRLDAIRTPGAPPVGEGTMPTAVFVAPDDLVFGDQALVRGDADPGRLVPDFVSSVGDPTAVIVVDGEEFSPADLYAWMIAAVVTRVAQLRGGPAQGIWAVVPASWGDDRIDAVADALDRDGHPEVDFITVPEALASRYSQVEPFDADLTLLVCDVDERELTATVVRATPQGHSRSIGAPIIARVSPDDEGSADLPARAVDAVVKGLGDAEVDVDDVDAIILSGVSGRLSQIERLLVDVFGDPIGTDPQPDLASALGAAHALAREEIAVRAAQPAATASGAAMASKSAVTHTVASTGRGAGASKWYRRPVGMVALGLAAVVLAGGAFASVFVLGAGATAGGDDVVRSASDSTATASDGAPVPTPSASPLSTTSRDAAPPATDDVEVDPPQAPANPRVPDSTTPGMPSAPVAAAEPPAATSPPAAPDPGVVPEPTTEPTAEPTAEPTPAPDPEPTPVPEPTPAPTPEPTSTPTPAPTTEPTSSPVPTPPGEGEPPAAP